MNGKLGLHPRLTWTTIALAVAAVAACSGGDGSNVTGPPAGNRRVAIGDTVSGSSSSGASNVHSFTAATGQTIALQVSVSNLFVHIVITDSTTGTVVVDNTVLGPVDLDHGVTGGFDARNAVYVVTVTPDPGQAVSFRYVITLVRSDPEVAPSHLTYGQGVTEPMSNAADVDDFIFDGTKDDELILFLQGLDNLFPGGLSLALTRDSTATVLATVHGHSGDPDPQSNTSGRIILPSTGRYRIHVVPDPYPSAAYVGNYRLEVDKINRAPEHVPAAVTPGDSIAGEAIEMVGDVDEFKLAAVAGEEYNVFVQATTGPASNALIAEVIGLTNTVIASAPSLGSDTLQLLQNGVGLFRVPSTGSYTIRVRGQSDLAGLNRGAYRLFVHKVNRHPETISAAPRTLGDTIAGESIEVPGDIDEIPVTISSPTLFHIETLRYGPLPHHTLLMELHRASDDSVIAANELDLNDGVPLPFGSGTLTTFVAAGSYVLRVHADSRQFGYRGGWRAILQAIDSMPEGHALNIAGSDTVTGVIDPPGDIDVYHMPVHKGEHWQIFFQGAYNGGVGNLFYARTETNLFFPNIQIGTAPSTGLSDAPHTGRLDVIADHEYQISVESNGSGQFPSYRGPYRFTVLPFSGVTEHHSPNLAPGDSVTDELMDFPGDLDQFDLSGAPGRELIIDLRADMPAGPPPALWVRVLDPVTHDSITGMQSFIAGQTTRRFRLPASGHVRVEALDPTGFTNTGPYYLKVQPIDRAPETLPAAYAVGDTLTGESVDFQGDIDEFTFSGTAGQKFRVYLEVVTGDPTGLGVRAELSPAGTETSLGAVLVTNPDLLLNNGSPIITLPATGTYVLRVRFDQEFLMVPATPYRAVVVSVP